MTDLQTMSAAAGDSGDPAARLALADALEEAGHQDAADRQRALAGLLARRPARFAAVRVVRDWWAEGPADRYRALLVADGRCHAAVAHGLTAFDPGHVAFWPGPAGEAWIAREGEWSHGYGCTLFDPDEPNAGVEGLDFLADSVAEVLGGLAEIGFEAGQHALVYLSGEPSREMRWFRFDGEAWEEVGPPADPPPELLRPRHFG